MATTFYSNAFQADGTAKSYKYVETGTYSVTGTYEIAAALVVNDLIKMVPVPAGARVKEVILATDDLDTGTDIVLDVGDTDGTDDTDRYIDAALTDQAGALGQVAGIARMNNVAGVNYQFAADGTIDVLVQTAPETGATTGTIVLTAILANDDTP